MKLDEDGRTDPTDTSEATCNSSDLADEELRKRHGLVLACCGLGTREDDACED